MPKNSIFAITEFILKKPYHNSINTMVDFSNLWNFQILFMSTLEARCVLKFPWDKFKEIFGENPRQKEYSIPNGAESFVDSIKVLNIIS